MDTQSKISLLQKDSQFHNLVWDYKLDAVDFVKMLDDPAVNDPDRVWAITRVLERANYYTTRQLLDKPTLKKYWPLVKPKIRLKALVTAYDFVLSR